MKENRFKTGDPEAMRGIYLAADVYRKWKEDFVDDELGEVVPVERCELVMEQGTLLDADAVSRLMFHFQADGITEVEVTDVRRTAKPGMPGGFTPWKVTVKVEGRAVVLLLYARSLEGAIAVAGEFASRTYHGLYRFEAAQGFKDSVFINKDFPDDEGEDVFGNEPEKVARVFYQAEISVLWHQNDTPTDRVFVMLARDVDEAREMVSDWVSDWVAREKARLEEQGDSSSERYVRLMSGYELRVKSATKIPCGALVPVEMSREYYDSLGEGAEI